MITNKQAPMLRDSFSPPALRSPEWRRAYDAVLSETDHVALFTRVEVAEAAMLTRLEDLQHSSDDHAERQTLEMALANLTVVKRERLKYDDGGMTRFSQGGRSTAQL